MAKWNKVKDLTGIRFGKLTVIKFSYMNEHRQSIWLCKCECGNEAEVARGGLIFGGTKSCGCIKSGANEVYHFDGGVTAIEINSCKYGQHFALIYTKDYHKIRKLKIGIRLSGDLTKKLYARVNSKNLHVILYGDEVPRNQMIDHINNADTLDNRRQNIRFATRQQNAFNSVKINNPSLTSKYKGVYFNSKIKKFVAQITHNRKGIVLGCFVDEVSAAAAYNAAAIKYFGDFARLNKIV